MTTKTYARYMKFNVYEMVFQYASIGDRHDVGLVLDAPCGCKACQKRVQPGHSGCQTYPEWMDNDKNLYARLVGGQWFWEYLGPFTGGVLRLIENE